MNKIILFELILYDKDKNICKNIINLKTENKKFINNFIYINELLMNFNYCEFISDEFESYDFINIFEIIKNTECNFIYIFIENNKLKFSIFKENNFIEQKNLQILETIEL
uniref:Uncharacterized protein n=1 Tax=viral metagenome TaxID=1070528 RepID=A0A6C0AFL6_9ZZZZ